MLNKGDLNFDFHDCTLEKVKKSERKFEIFLLPCQGIFSDINHISFYEPKILKNELSSTDYGRSVWLSYSACLTEKPFTISIIFQNDNREHKRLVLSFKRSNAVTDDITEEKRLLKCWGKSRHSFRFLTAKSDLRIVKRWINSEFYSNPIVPRLINDSVRNAMLSLCRSEKTQDMDKINIYQRFDTDYSAEISDYNMYIPLLRFSESYDMLDCRTFDKDEGLYYMELSLKFLTEVKKLLEKDF